MAPELYTDEMTQSFFDIMQMWRRSHFSMFLYLLLAHHFMHNRFHIECIIEEVYEEFPSFH